MENDRIAIFIDAENLTSWLKAGGSELLLEELSTIGQTVVRRAYGIWNNLTPYQAGLNRLGFELIHSFHPVKGKNSTDIQMTVDIMEYIWRVENINWFVLATGDSDFSPLFRRLREMGKDVIGVGPRSALSESVKSSCSRFIYTNTIVPAKDNFGQNDKIQTAFDDAADLVEKVLYTVESPIRCSLLKSRMRNIDSAFDEKDIGFQSFNSFLQALDGVAVYYDNDKKAWFVSMCEESSTDPRHENRTTSTLTNSTVVDKPLPLNDIYRSLLRKKGWQNISKNTLLTIYHKWVALGALSKPEITEKLIEDLNGDITSSEIKKAMSLFFKARLITIERDAADDDAMWKVNSVKENELLVAIDKAMVPRLISACDERGISVEIDQLEKLLISSGNGATIKTWIEEARVAVVEE
jgi:uncharacterized protein (TIGR00288 family)